MIDISPLQSIIKGDLHLDDLHRILYATDASVYRELPLGVVYPSDAEDVRVIVKFCAEHKIAMIPRAGGTSLAGQCVGVGLVMDTSRYMTRIVSVDLNLKTATVEPGVIRDELNYHLKQYGLMFGPNTSTANRATIGGMVGNNSCGSTSIVFGSTRDHIRKLDLVLSDGSAVSIGVDGHDLLENELGREIFNQLQQFVADDSLQSEIKKEYPHPKIKRRNTGYALDLVAPDAAEVSGLDICKLLCGSEGTLAISTEIEIGLVDLPPDIEVLVAIHYASVDSALRSVPLIMQHQPFACELMDKTILDCTKGQLMYEQDRFFIDGDPEAVMLVSVVADHMDKAEGMITSLVAALRTENHGYAYPVISENIDRVWNLRKAGLGLLANLPGDKKAVACIEDTAVAIDDLASYIAEFSGIMDKYNQKSVYYAHAGDGEIHLRPILDLKKDADRLMFHDISEASAKLVKKYSGSLSGEHGDGRVRAPFIKDMYGGKIYEAFRQLKRSWDPDHLLNPGKIVDAPPMNTYLRYDQGHVERRYDTVFDFDSDGGILRLAEKCNGSGDCRKLPLSGGTMCPSYMATRKEKDTTRARANVLREVLTRPNAVSPWSRQELSDVMDLCLSCKGCTSECPSNVDMSTIKAEVLHQQHQLSGVPLRSRLFANFNRLSQIGSKVAPLTNYILQHSVTGSLMKRMMGVHRLRSIPKMSRRPLRSTWKNYVAEVTTSKKHKTVYLFCDEFTNWNDREVGETAVRLLSHLGYDIRILKHQESGRAAISKGVLTMAKSLANANIELFKGVVNADQPLVGIEPSAILTFRDEYPRLVDDALVDAANEVARHTFTIEEFLYRETLANNITAAHFDGEVRHIKLHGHCHQKALTDINEVAWLLSLPTGHKVDVIPSGCCGMAGSFGYEVEHYDLSMQIGEMVLFPAIRSAGKHVTIAASGTSCRHQISDGTGRTAKHVVEVLWEAISTSNKQT